MQPNKFSLGGGGQFNSKFKKALPIILLLFLITFVIGMTYAIATYTQAGGINTITTGKVSMSYTESTNVITLNNALPISDKDGKLLDEYFDFSVTSTVEADQLHLDIDMPYEISIETLSVDSGYTALTDVQVKVYLENRDNNAQIVEPTLIYSLPVSTFNSNQKVLFLTKHTHISEESSITTNYRLRAWLDYETDASYFNETNYQYKFRVNINSDSSNIKTNPNKPELASNMIPVYYDGSTWRKASTSNINNNWYDYSNKMWANAVTVTEVNGSRTDLLNARVGTEIPMERINTMWVWIPRFNATEGGIKCSEIQGVSFETHPYCYTVTFSTEDTAKLIGALMQVLGVSQDEAQVELTKLLNGGTINGMDLYGCLAYYTQMTGEVITPETTTFNENKTPMYNGGTIENPGPFNVEFVKNTEEAHEAFTFGTQELNGFWYAKFETAGTLSTNYQACSNETCDISNITIKPNETSLRDQTVSSFFYAARSMEQTNNPYGFSTSKDTNLNVHMSKNREWGAVAYLTQSEYGRCTDGTCTEITINNCYNSGVTTGIGADAIGDAESSTTCTTAVNMYNGEKGVLASTTGNIYGIYDMSGGTLEYVMGIFNDGTNIYSGYSTGNNSGFNGYLYNDGTPIEKIDGIEFFSINSNSKYYDTYTNTGSYDNAQTDYTNDRQHALLDTSMWYGDYVYFVNPNFPWFPRGGYYSGESNAGVFAFYSNGGYGYDFGSRFAVVVK